MSTSNPKNSESLFALALKVSRLDEKTAEQVIPKLCLLVEPDPDKDEKDQNEANREEVARCQYVHQVINAMDDWKENHAIQKYGCRILQILAYHDDSFCNLAKESFAIATVVSAIVNFEHDDEVPKEAFAALRNLTFPENTDVSYLNDFMVFDLISRIVQVQPALENDGGDILYHMIYWCNKGSDRTLAIDMSLRILAMVPRLARPRAAAFEALRIATEDSNETDFNPRELPDRVQDNIIRYVLDALKEEATESIQADASKTLHNMVELYGNKDNKIVVILAKRKALMSLMEVFEEYEHSTTDHGKEIAENLRGVITTYTIHDNVDTTAT